jgi:hypothetical protein
MKATWGLPRWKYYGVDEPSGASGPGQASRGKTDCGPASGPGSPLHNRPAAVERHDGKRVLGKPHSPPMGEPAASRLGAYDCAF